MAQNTLLYTPGVKIAIAASASQQVIDISDDIESGNMTLRQNNPHSLNFTVSNPNGKYGAIFTPDDRIIVQMKRINWLQTFSGYLDKVPYFQAYPGSVTFSATCTLKRLKYHYWDPNYQDTITFIGDAYNNGYTSVTGAQEQTDAGMQGVLVETLTQIVGWDQTKIHIGGVPTAWLQQLQPLFGELQEVEAGWISGAATGQASSAVGTSTTVSGVSIGPGTQWTAADWAAAVISQAGAPVSLNNVINVLHWMAREGNQLNWWTIAGQYNPLNCGLNSGGGDGTGSYQNLWVAAVNTGNNIVGSENGPTIGAALLADVDLNTFAEALIAAPWASSRYNGDIPSITTNTIIPNQKAPAAAGKVQGAIAVSSNHLGTGTGGTSGGDPSNLSISAQTTAAFAESVTQAPGWQTAVAWATANLVSEVGTDGGSRGITNGNLDCSAYVQAAWYNAGVNIPGTSEAMYADPNIVLVDVNSILPGDILFGNGDGSYPPPGHVAIYLGNGQVGQHDPVKTTTLADWISGEQTESQKNTSYGGAAFYGVGRVTTSGGKGLTKNLTKYNPTSANVTAGAGTGGLNTDSNGSLIYPTGQWQPAAAPSDPSAAAFDGLKVLMLDTPIQPFITEVVNASLRNYCSAPNGDFIAWFPDYFGQYGYAATWHLSTVELIDFDISWSDENLVTHQYVAGSMSTYNTSLNPEDGGGNVTWEDELVSYGVATIDMPGLLTALTGVSTTDPGLFSSTTSIYEQFGARPNFVAMSTVGAPSVAEFWFAIQQFQENWANQFSTTVSMTFMPELWPGMLLAVDDLGFQCYVTEVTHDWNLSDDGGFSTSVSVCAPSVLSDSAAVNGTGGLIGLAKAGPIAATNSPALKSS